MTSARMSPSTGFLARWIIACAVGEAVGLVLAGVVGVAAMPDPAREAGPWLGHASMLLAGLLEGLSLGAAQWWALRRRLRTLHPGPFVSVTATAMAAAWAMGSLTSLIEPEVSPGPGSVVLVAALTGAGVGIIMGASQWLVLRRHGRTGPTWVGAMAGGWALGMTVQTLGASLLPGGPYEPSMVLLGLVTGAITGLVVALATSPAVLRLADDGR